MFGGGVWENFVGRSLRHVWRYVRGLGGLLDGVCKKWNYQKQCRKPRQTVDGQNKSPLVGPFTGINKDIKGMLSIFHIRFRAQKLRFLAFSRGSGGLGSSGRLVGSISTYPGTRKRHEELPRTGQRIWEPAATQDLRAIVLDGKHMFFWVGFFGFVLLILFLGSFLGWFLEDFCRYSILF